MQNYKFKSNSSILNDKQKRYARRVPMRVFGNIQ